jgi:hypothetical protein
MNLADARVVLRPRTLADILDLAALWCFAADRKLYARLSALVLLPSLLGCVAARWLGHWSWGQVWLLAAALATVSQGVFTVATSRALFERDVQAGLVLRGLLRRLPAYLGALVVTRAILLASALTLVLLPFAWARVAMVHEVCLLEGAPPIKATARAWQLARHRGGEIVLLLLGLLLALAAAVGAAELLGHGVVEVVLQLGRPLGELWEDGGSLYALVGFHAVVPYLAVARFLGYVDQRTRGDGWDIQLRLMALMADEPTTAGGAG